MSNTSVERMGKSCGGSNVATFVCSGKVATVLCVNTSFTASFKFAAHCYQEEERDCVRHHHADVRCV